MRRLPNIQLKERNSNFGCFRDPMTRLSALISAVLILMLLALVPTHAQTNTGELRLKVTDPQGLGVKTSVAIQSDANQYHATFPTNDQGALTLQRLPFGVYQEVPSTLLRVAS